MLLRAMATVASLTLASRLAGFVRDVVTAALLGAGPIADAFFVALKIPNFFRRITAEGAFSVSFIPMYAGMRTKEGEETANTFAATTMGVMIAFLLPFTVLVIAAMPHLMWAIAPGFTGDPARFEPAVHFSRITFPYLLLMSLTALLGGALNAHNRFAPFAAAPILFNGCMVVCLIIGAYMFNEAGAGLAYGVTVAGAVQLAFVWWAAQRAGVKLMPSRPHMTPDIKRLFTLMVPGMIGAGVVQINLFADVMIASFLNTGAVSHLYYADRLNQLPLGTVGIAVGTALLPILSSAVAKEDKSETSFLFSRAVEVCVLLALPAALALAILCRPIIFVLFQRGAFNVDDATITAHVLAAYSMGLPAYILGKVLSTACFARQDTVTPVVVSSISVVTNICLALSFVFGLRMGEVGIALGTGIAGWVQLIPMLVILRRRGLLELDTKSHYVLPRLAASAGAMALVLLVAMIIARPFIDGGEIVRALALGGLMAAGGLTYLGVIIGTKAITMDDLKLYFKKGNARA